MRGEHSLTWQSAFWNRVLAPWQVGLGLAVVVLAEVILWRAAAALGDNLRIDASVSTDCQLVGVDRTGRCGIRFTPLFLGDVRAGGVLVADGGLLLFLCGTEILVRVEDRLMGNRFGMEFERYRRRCGRVRCRGSGR